jgi:cytochrome c6
MRKIILLAVVFVFAWGMSITVSAQKGSAKTAGEGKFNELCALCHPDGGNIVNPKKTLHKKDREANNIRTESDIIKIMRKPGTGMTSFDEKTVPDKEAQEIAKYILMTFK